MGLGSRFTPYELPQHLAWMESWPAVLMFAAATLVEVAAFYILWLDNAPDTVAATGENAAATGLSLLALILPLIAFVLVVILLVLMLKQVQRLRHRRQKGA